MIKVSKRLEAISSLVLDKSNVIDIGCDHGILDIYLYESKKVNKIVATDINRNALNNAVKNIKENNLSDKIETRLGNGLDVINNDDAIDTAIIAGMGAHTIIGICKNNLSKLKNIDNLIIESNTKNELLRKEICKLNYYIDDELLVEDNKKIYTVIRFKRGKKGKYDNKELYFGPILLKKNDKIFNNYKKQELEKLCILLKLMPKNKIINRWKIKQKIKLYK